MQRQPLRLIELITCVMSSYPLHRMYSLQKTPCLHANWDVHQNRRRTESVAPPSARLRRCINTGTSIPGRMNCTSRDIGHLVETATVKNHSFLHVWTPKLSARNGHEDNLVQELHLWNLHGLQQFCTTTGMSPLTQELHLWNFHGLQQFCTTAHEH